MRFTPPILGLALILGACSSSGTEATTTETTTTESAANGVEELFPDVVDAVATQANDGSWSFSVTLSSPYDSPDRYADSWRVLSADGTIFGERFLTHDHAGEQPFTRSQTGIEIPDDVTSVVIEGRDQVSGWGGTVLELDLDRS